MRLFNTRLNHWEFLTHVAHWTWPRHGAWPVVKPNIEWWGFGPFELLRTQIKWPLPPARDRGLA